MKKGDDDNIHISISQEEEDYKHLDNLVKGHVSNSNAQDKNFMDNLPESYAESSNVDYSKESESEKNLSPVKKKAIKLIKASEDDRITTNLTSLVRIVVLNKDKLIVFSESQNWFVGLKNKKVQIQDLFEKLSPSDAVLSFPACEGLFDYNVLVVYKGGKLLLVNLLKSAENQKLIMASTKVTFTNVESQSVADSVTERSDAGERKFLVPLSGSEFALVFEQSIKLYQITDFELRWVKEYDEIVNDSISNFWYYHDPRKGALTHLAIGTESSSQIALYNIKDEWIDKTLNFDEGTITSVFEIGNRYIAATTIEGYFAAWDKNTHIQIFNEQLMDDILYVFKIPNTDLIAIGGHGPLFIFNELDKAAEIKIKGNEDGIVDIAYNESKQLLVFGNETGTIFTYWIDKLL